ncbi:MAG: zinc ribbon domain-containing protein [Tenuifilaceae bacterium]
MKTIRFKYACPKCGNHEFEIGEVFMPGSIMAKLFNFEYRKFCSVTCSKCTNTELFKTPKKDIQNVLDFMLGR